jgi:hypothetical protein
MGLFFFLLLFLVFNEVVLRRQSGVGHHCLKNMQTILHICTLIHLNTTSDWHTYMTRLLAGKRFEWVEISPEMEMKPGALPAREKSCSV